jgi:LuxR family maltose regulon positive regulatory protein
MARKIPTVWVAFSGTMTQAALEIPDGAERTIRLESAAWWDWLESTAARSFAYPLYDQQAGYIRSFMTVRKEQRERGSDYWVAYHRVGTRLRKIYLGRAAELTRRQLAAIAERFLSQEASVGAAQKEVMPGQLSGASFRWEAMMRRVKSRYLMVHLGRP